MFRLSLDRLEEAWRKYENNKQEVLGLILEEKVEDEPATFNEMEEKYEAAINEAKKFIKGKFEAQDKRDLPRSGCEKPRS